MIDFYYDRDYDYKNFGLHTHSKKKTKRFADVPLKSKGGIVYAVEKLNMTAFYIGEKAKLKFGVARCHKDDAFVKKVGRDLAISKMSEVEFTVVRILQEDDKIYYRFKNDKHEVEIMFKKDKPVSRLDFAGEV
jgi:hypothetical protein